MKFTWIGGPSFLLELGPFRIVGDPVLSDQITLDGAVVTRVGPRPEVDIAGADLVLVTSLRADHFDAAAVAVCGAARVLLPGGGVESAQRVGIEGARDFAHGELMRIERDSSALVVHSVAAGPPAGAAADNGYFLKLERGEHPFTAYVTGDTMFSDATREIQRTHGYSNLLVLHVGAERSGGRLLSADAKEAMQIVYRMQPNAIAAVHHSTFSHYTEPIAPFLDKISLTIYEKRLRRLREGESFEKVIGPGE
jgi:L-ascorbate metabolism protein UlaG (beta-lactamase superfamily)